MATTAVPVYLSPSRGLIEIHETAGGGSATISNTTLQATFPAGTPLGDLVRTHVADSPAAVAAMLGMVGEPSQHKTGRIFMGTQLTGALAIPPTVIPTESANQITLVCTTAAAGDWVFYAEQIHSALR